MSENYLISLLKLHRDRISVLEERVHELEKNAAYWESQFIAHEVKAIE